MQAKYAIKNLNGFRHYHVKVGIGDTYV